VLAKMLTEIMAHLWNGNKTHRTPNTRSLDEKFDHCSDFRSSRANGKNISHMLLSLAKLRGYFVAVPFDSKYFSPFSIWKCSAVDALHMVNEGYLAIEKIYPDVFVVSATEKLLREMYNH
jgi:hypothetical protein